jgi:hypothetical protein
VAPCNAKHFTVWIITQWPHHELVFFIADSGPPHIIKKVLRCAGVTGGEIVRTGSEGGAPAQFRRSHFNRWHSKFGRDQFVDN